MSKFFRGVAVLAGGTAGSQIILIAASPFLARLYSPEQFGLLAIYISILSVFVVIASLSYELAIPLPKSDRDGATLLILSLGMVAGVAVASGALAFWFRDLAATALGAPMLAEYWWLLSIGVLMGGGYKALNLWAVRNKDFTQITRTKLNQSFFIVTFQLLLFKFGAFALLAGHALGQGVGAIRLGAPAIRKTRGLKITFKECLKIAVRYKDFPLINLWTKAINVAGKQMPPLLLAYFLNPVVAGLYALAHRVTANPLGIITTSVSNAFFSFGAESHRENKLRYMLEDVHRKLFIIAFLLGVNIFLFSPELFSYLFGSEWKEAGLYARWMALWLIFQVSSGPLTVVFSVVERQGVGLVMQVQLFIVRVLALYIGSTLGDGLTTVKFFCVGSAASYLLISLSIFVVSGASIALLVRNYLGIAAAGVAIFLPAAVAVYLQYGLAISIPLAALGAAIYSVVFIRDFRTDKI